MASPAAPMNAAPANRLATIGLVSLLLALVELAWFGYRLVGALVAGVLDYAQRALLPGAVPPAVASAAASVTETIRRLAGWEAASLVPYATLAIALGVIGIGLASGRASWLAAARAWCWLAFAALAISVAIQVMFILPELEHIGRFVDVHLAGGRGKTAIVVPSMLPLWLHAILAAIWPVGLWFWAGALRRPAAR